MPALPSSDAAQLRLNAVWHAEAARALLASPLPPAGPRRAYREQQLRGYRQRIARLHDIARQVEAGADARDLIPINSGLIIAAAFSGRV